MIKAEWCFDYVWLLDSFHGEWTSTLLNDDWLIDVEWLMVEQLIECASTIASHSKLFEDTTQCDQRLEGSGTSQKGLAPWFVVVTWKIGMGHKHPEKG